MLPELNSALVSGKQADRGSGEAVSRKKSAVFFVPRLWNLTVEHSGGAETRRRQRHGHADLWEIPRFVTKIVIAARTTRIGELCIDKSSLKVSQISLAFTAVTKNPGFFHPGTSTREKTRSDRTIFS